MRRYLLRRLWQMLLLILGISLVAFAVMQLAPGDPVDMLVERHAAPEVKAQIRQLYGLDQPLTVQYLRWLSRALQGDFGRSFVSGEPVLHLILERLPYTLYLNLVVLVLLYLIAVPLGMLSALRRHSRLDHAITLIAFCGQSLPGFWLAMLLIYLVAVPSHGWLPINGMASYGINIQTAPLLTVVLDRLRHLILPALVMLLGDLAGVARYVRSSLLEVLQQDYIRTARAKGLSERAVNYRHALRNALLPLVTLVGLELPILFSGTFLLEVVFSWPGLGLVLMRAVQQRDYPVVMAFNTLSATLMVAGNFLADLLYLAVDPRIRYD